MIERSEVKYNYNNNEIIFHFRQNWHSNGFASKAYIFHENLAFKIWIQIEKTKKLDIIEKIGIKVKIFSSTKFRGFPDLFLSLNCEFAIDKDKIHHALWMRFIIGKVKQAKSNRRVFKLVSRLFHVQNSILFLIF